MTTPSLEKLVHGTGYPVQTVLIDCDFRSPEQLVIGGDPDDLNNVPSAPVKSLLTPWAVATIVAPEEEGQGVADLLADKPELVQLAARHAEYYFRVGVMEFSLNALTDEQKRNAARNTGVRLGDGKQVGQKVAGQNRKPST